MLYTLSVYKLHLNLQSKLITHGCVSKLLVFFIARGHFDLAPLLKNSTTCNAP